MFIPFSFFNAPTTIQVITGSAITGPVYTLINTIIPYLRSNSSSFRNPDFFAYRLDGTAYQISDGDRDMFDGGNSTVPWLRANTAYWNPGASTLTGTPALSYASQSSVVTDASFYYASFGYTQSAASPTRVNDIYHPLTLIGARSGSGPTGWQKTGNIGADGAGSILTGSIYTGSLVNGFTTYAYFRQTYGQASDPNICDVYILLGHPNWSSTFGTVVWAASLSTLGQGAALYATGSSENILAITTLLSRTGSSGVLPSLPISTNDITTVVNNYTLKIKEVLNY